MVRDGYEFVVYDAKTGEDITRSVLAQIMVEKETSEGDNLLPTSFLKNLIGFYGDSVQGAIPNYLESTFDIFVKNQERLREQITQSIQGMTQGMQGMSSMSPMKGMFGGPALEEMNRQNMAAFERTMKMFTPFGMNGFQQKKDGSSDANRDQKIRELKQSIAEMQKELNRMAAE
jgi:polyhydroxyalkanoate synthesis repressor PhaR